MLDAHQLRVHHDVFEMAGDDFEKMFRRMFPASKFCEAENTPWDDSGHMVRLLGWFGYLRERSDRAQERSRVACGMQCDACEVVEWCKSCECPTNAVTCKCDAPEAVFECMRCTRLGCRELSAVTERFRLLGTWYPGGKVITRNSLTEKLGVGETEAELIRLCILERRVEVDRLLDAFGEPQWSDDEVSTRGEQVVGNDVLATGWFAADSMREARLRRAQYAAMEICGWLDGSQIINRTFQAHTFNFKCAETRTDTAQQLPHAQRSAAHARARARTHTHAGTTRASSP